MSTARVRRIMVKVPGSTSNIGPGFDCLGLAVRLHNEVILEAHPAPGEPICETAGEGGGSLPSGRENLLLRAASLIIPDLTRNRLVFKAFNRVPVSRGIGSSGAAVVAGLLAANHIFGKPRFSLDDLFERAISLEGHPDNVAAAIYGGCVVSVKARAGFIPFPLKPHRDLAVVLCVPEMELSTAQARAVLPQDYSRRAAVLNVSRALILSSALERGLWDRLPEAMADEFHQPYRADLLPGFEDVLAAARDHGECGAALSGAGSSMLALCRRGPGAVKIGRAMSEAFSRHRVKSRVLVLRVDRRGARISRPG
ncbi:MAG: homoserine kinase [Elusimicrobia bacterium]|nr:homoserine kinase [Elusimicrobiota bacterium]